MKNQEQEIIDARTEFFNKLRKKNEINHARIEQLDLDNIGVVLNYQQTDLLTLALKNNKVGYKKYQDDLLPTNEFLSLENEKLRHLLILKELMEDEKMPDKVKITLERIYNETKNDKSINDFILMSTLYKLVSKLSMDLQNIIFNKLNNSYRVSKEGIKDMSIEDALNLFSYINNDYTSITLTEVTSYKYFVNFNDTYNRLDFEKMLKFAYDNDKQARINYFTNYDSFPNYLIKQSKDIVKQKLLAYVDNLTRYIKNYNATHTRIDRKPFIRSIDVFSDLITDTAPFIWRGNIDDYKESGWQSVLSLEDLCDVIKIARNNLPNISFVYNENKLENKEKRQEVIEVIKAIQNYEKKHKVKLIDVIGIKMHVDLDVLKENIIDMFQDLSKLNMPIAITEFDICAPYDMLFNNSNLEIEILRDRFISDFCNIISNVQNSKTIKIDSINIDSINDKQNHMLFLINEERARKKEPLLKTIYGGMYTDDMNKKDILLKEKKTKRKNKEKGGSETIILASIILTLLLIIAIISYIFIKLV